MGQDSNLQGFRTSALVLFVFNVGVSNPVTVF